MLKRSLWAAALAVGLSSHAQAQQTHAQGQRMMLVDEAGRPINTTNALPVAGGSGGGTVTLALTTSNTAQLTYVAPAGHWVRLVSTVSGTGSTAIVSQVEETLN